ncbi:maleylpyruvate isomerase N-terminal domain-containing protein [Microbacterium sp. NPDC056569]|uniref:maleylpyruvate isomerase N-terminal domain-containing protein n=1 Tax=Microbacterium sp. NPDC056569 TaxID=3345867 RepID=UPI00366A855E
MPARTDNVRDPARAEELLLARRGQAFWARALNDLRDAEIDAPSRLPGWTRRHLIAHVGLNARGLARLVESARTGEKLPMYASPAQRDDEIAFAATLPVEALRNLAAHAAVHLNVEWRDLPAARWSAPVLLLDGTQVPVSHTVRMRAREVWHHAIDLDSGASPADMPEALASLIGTDHGRASANPWCPDLTDGFTESTP